MAPLPYQVPLLCPFADQILVMMMTLSWMEASAPAIPVVAASGSHVLHRESTGRQCMSVVEGSASMHVAFAHDTVISSRDRKCPDQAI